MTSPVRSTKMTLEKGSFNKRHLAVNSCLLDATVRTDTSQEQKTECKNSVSTRIIIKNITNNNNNKKIFNSVLKSISKEMQGTAPSAQQQKSNNRCEEGVNTRRSVFVKSKIYVLMLKNILLRLEREERV